MAADAPSPVELATARIGERVATLRSARSMRVSELARQAGVSSSLISQIERGQTRPSVGTLFAIALTLDVPVDDFFASPDEASSRPPADRAPVATVEAVLPHLSDPPAGTGENGSRMPPAGRAGESREREVVRRDQRAAIDIRGGVRWERLTATALDGVEFLELVYAPGAESDAQSYRHPGVELVVTTHGVMTIFLGFDRHDLYPGDSIGFPSSTPHRYVNLTAGETRAITVILRDDLSTLGLRETQPTEDEAGPG